MTTDEQTPAEAIAARAPAGIQVTRALAWWLVVGGIIGSIASFDLIVEKMMLLSDPTYVPTCSINAVFACGSVMTSDQANAFGFANPILGTAGFAMVIASGFGILAGGSFRRWYWWGMQIGVIFGVIFVHWLMYASMAEIRALCPYCMVVWVVTIVTFWYITANNLRAGVFGDSPGVRRIGDLAYRFAPAGLAIWFAAIVAAAIVSFPALLG